MSARYRIIAVALGLAFIASVSAGIWAIWSLEEYYAYERQDIAKRQNSEAHSGIEACGEIPYVFSPSKCISDAIAAAKEENASYKDLKAQQHMSLSALGVLIVSAITMLVTAVGVVFVYFTLRETKRTVDVTREIGEAQARAYLSLDIDTFEVVGLPDKPGDDPTDGLNGMKISALGKVVNSGASPAVGFRIFYDIKIVGHDQRIELKFPDDFQDGGWTANYIPASGSVGQTLSYRVRTDLDALKEGVLFVYFAYIIQYEDVFDKENTTPFRAGYVRELFDPSKKTQIQWATDPEIDGQRK